ncbi:hypothetical protein [Caldimonas brevitalea]|uniref:hypothetical protein n=1 Tax=Caldimonas brevitalea TaxID=413882 RepID=UPI00146FFE2E|nr:hypothetical protein [Caldimonas brevitalea]
MNFAASRLFFYDNAATKPSRSRKSRHATAGFGDPEGLHGVPATGGASIEMKAAAILGAANSGRRQNQKLRGAGRVSRMRMPASAQYRGGGHVPKQRSALIHSVSVGRCETGGRP